MAPVSHRDDSFAQSHFFAFSPISTRQRSRLDRIIVGQSDGRHTFILLGIRTDPIVGAAQIAVSRMTGSSGDAANRSVAQIELSAKPIGDFLGASLIPDQIARRGKNRRLKTEGVILANNNF
jgi:hypothetical protein